MVSKKAHKKSKLPSGVFRFLSVGSRFVRCQPGRLEQRAYD